MFDLKQPHVAIISYRLLLRAKAKVDEHNFVAKVQGQPLLFIYNHDSKVPNLYTLRVLISGVRE